MQNVNTYDPEKFSKEFPKSNLYKRLINNLPQGTLLHYDWYWHNSEGMGRDIDTEYKEGFPVSIFYYLQILLETTATKIYDIGCGQNMFKRLADDRIYGIDPGLDPFIDPKGIDEIESFNQDFVQKYRNSMEAAMAVNSLHFVRYDELQKQLQDFVSCLKVGGRGLVCLNAARFSDDIQGLQLEQHVRQSVQGLVGVDFKVVDIDIQGIANEFSNGNVRLVFDRTV
jgi:SAM-dependent methyltransferase